MLHVDVKITVLIAILLVSAHLLHASQAVKTETKTSRRQQASTYCSALQCWSQMPCFQHPQHNARAIWHDAQRSLPDDLLFMIGAYAQSEHTHVIEKYPFERTEMRNSFLTLIAPWKKIYVHVFNELRPECYIDAMASVDGRSCKVLKEGVDLGDDSTYTNILCVDSNAERVATVALTPEQKAFFRKMSLQQCKAICRKATRSDIDVLLDTDGAHPIKDLMRLAPAREHTLEQAGFLRKKQVDRVTASLACPA